jgi:hypothetical protein
MTMRTYRHFSCANGHEGIEKTSENDQPYSTPWESVTTTGLTSSKKDQLGYNGYSCVVCGLEMVLKSSK